MSRTRRIRIAPVLVCLMACTVAGGEAPDVPDGCLSPSDVRYIGAFRLPDGPDEYAWGWSGQALAYRADGDPDGSDDGHPGSLFGTGHDWHQHVSEITIPRPVLSAEKALDDLPTAKTLQPFADIGGPLFEEMEQARVGLACLPAQGEQRAAKLYFCRGPHAHEAQAVPSHGWCALDLSSPKPAGPWKIGDEWTYVTTDYLLPIPEGWAGKHAGGMRLGTGRFRDGGQGSQGPTLLAIAPWKHGNPPERGASLEALTLLRYSSVTDDEQHTLKDYHHSDDWAGAAWLTASDRSAVVFVGTKGKGDCWYGFANGVVWPEEGPWPEVPEYPNDQRGWWSSRFVAEMLFYDPADLAAVAAGEMEPWEPQPYATLDVSDRLFAEHGQRQMRHVGAVACDPARGVLYVIELRGDGDKSLIHAWRFAAARERDGEDAAD
ncbi:MAG: hypothetical protein KGY99_08350 [Phycisphaerae bacterium]|nr:hypothetical protein [Phycisphaerae bacterium]